MGFHLLSFGGVAGAAAGFFAVGFFAFQHGLPVSLNQPAQNSNDYIPAFYVTAAALCMLYVFLFNQTGTVFIEHGKAKRAYREKKTDKKPTLLQLKYSHDNIHILAADRCAGNFLEQLVPFLVSVWCYATFVSATGAAKYGWLWLFFRSYYLLVFKKPFPALFLSTLPAYTCIWYMMGSAVYAVATNSLTNRA